MADTPLTQFDLDPARQAVLKECMEYYGMGEPGAEWPNNIISTKAVVYGSGVIAREREAVRHAVDPAELTLCQRLAAEAAEVMDGVEVGMGSESEAYFREFFIAGNIDEEPPKSLTEDLLREKFGGTLFPPVTISIEPLAEAGAWWKEVQADGEDSEPDYFEPWRKMIEWFQAQPEFVASYFIRIGKNSDLWQLPQEQWPAGTEATGCVLPRLAIGLTQGGSIAGLFGNTVQT